MLLKFEIIWMRIMKYNQFFWNTLYITNDINFFNTLCIYIYIYIYWERWDREREKKTCTGKIWNPKAHFHPTWLDPMETCNFIISNNPSHLEIFIILHVVVKFSYSFWRRCFSAKQTHNSYYSPLLVLTDNPPLIQSKPDLHILRQNRLHVASVPDISISKIHVDNSHILYFVHCTKRR